MNAGEEDRLKAASTPDASQRLLGYIMIAAGCLMTLLGGACTLAWVGMIVTSILQSGVVNSPNGVLPALLLTVPVGGLPIAAGVAMVVSGRGLLRRPKPRLDVF